MMVPQCDRGVSTTNSDAMKTSGRNRGGGRAPDGHPGSAHADDPYMNILRKIGECD